MKQVLGALAAVVWLGATGASADVVKVGLIVSYSGAFAMWGTQFQQAIEAYQAVYGKTVKGPDGKEHEIQFIYRDAASAGADKAKQLAEELVVRDRVKFLAGFELSPHAMAVAETADQAKVPVVIMNAATASITRGSPYYVRVSFTIPQLVGAGRAMGRQARGFKRSTRSSATMRPATTLRPISQRPSKRPAARSSAASRTPHAGNELRASTWRRCCRPSLTRSSCFSRRARPRSRS